MVGGTQGWQLVVTDERSHDQAWQLVVDDERVATRVLDHDGH